MRATERAWRIGRDFAGVVPRAHAAVSGSDDWNLLSSSGARVFGEVLADELALTGMTLTAPPPKLERSLASCADAVGELADLGVAGANAEPDRLQIADVQRRRIGRLVYE